MGRSGVIQIQQEDRARHEEFKLPLVPMAAEARASFVAQLAELGVELKP